MDSFVENVYHSGLFGEVGPGAGGRVFDVCEALSNSASRSFFRRSDWTVMDSSTMAPVPSLQVVANQGVDATGNVCADQASGSG